MAQILGFKGFQRSLTSTARFQLQLSAIARSFSVGEVKSATSPYTRFAPVEVVDGGVAIVRLDGPGKVNTIDPDFMREAERLCEHELAVPGVKAVVFTSAKKGNFIAGADINVIAATEDKSTFKDFCMEAHGIFAKLRGLGKPLVAAIDGTCMGGGLEWALHCDYRVATDSPKTILALPEVKLGLLPGFAGTQRLPKTVGVKAALDMILTGKNVRADKARKIGLVNQVVSPVSLETVAVDCARKLATGELKAKPKKKSAVDKVLEDFGPGRSVVFSQAEKMVQKNTDGHYPAPFAILDCIKEGFNVSPDKALEYEATRFAELAGTTQSEALIGIFNGMTALKKNPFGSPAKEDQVQTVGVLGAGLMGAGIAQVSLEKGMKVLLKDKDLAGASRGEKGIKDALKKKLQRRRKTNHQMCLETSRLVPLHDSSLPHWGDHFKNCDLVIEAVFEDLGVKHRVIQEMEQYLPHHCIFATNTSALPIESIAEASQRPENVVGMHYFSPVPAMPLLEVITHKGTSERAASKAVDVGLRQGKTVVVVKDVPGFYVNRCLGPYLVETTALLQDGVELEALDKALKSYGLPMGPITLADMVGLDVANHVQEFLSKADLGVRMSGGDTSLMSEMVSKGMLGQKAGKGFFLYPPGKGKKAKPQINPEAVEMVKSAAKRSLDLKTDEIQNRMISRFVNEAILCLQDGIISSAPDGDIGAVFGMGFPPFLGGPFRMVHMMGIDKYHTMVSGFAEKYGEQFAPPQLLEDMVKSGKKFY